MKIRLTKKVDDTAGVPPLVVVPGNDLNEVVVEGDSGLGIEDAGSRVADHVAGDDLIFGVLKDALQWSFSGFLDGLLDVFVRRALLEAAGQVNDRDVGGRDAHGHAREL